MPIYEYHCDSKDCNSGVIEVFQKVDDEPPICEQCKQPLMKLISKGSFILKGNWFKNTKSY